MEEVGKLRVIPPGQPARLEPVVSLAESEPSGLGVCQGCTAVIDNNDLYETSMVCLRLIFINCKLGVKILKRLKLECQL